MYFSGDGQFVDTSSYLTSYVPATSAAAGDAASTRATCHDGGPGRWVRMVTYQTPLGARQDSFRDSARAPGTWRAASTRAMSFCCGAAAGRGRRTGLDRPDLGARARDDGDRCWMPGHSGRSAAKSSSLLFAAAAVRPVEHLARVDLRALVGHEDVDVLDVLLVGDRARRAGRCRRGGLEVLGGRARSPAASSSTSAVNEPVPGATGG